jgi:hypothetical protein
MARNGFLSLLVLLGLQPSWIRGAMRDEIDVTLKIVDEQGSAVPHATVWGYLLPRANPLAIDADDLWRLTTRYQSSFEFALDVHNSRPVDHLMVHPMGDESGRFRRTIDYRNVEGSAAKRPEKTSIGFTVMKRGYLPARIDFAVTRESTLTGTVVLKRDPHREPISQPYLVAFDRLRHELSDNRRVEEMNHQRLERLRTDLEATARQAVEAGDRKAAARIYARMQYLPSIIFLHGKPSGFSPAEPYSEQSWAYLVKAYTLDPTNPYVAAEYMYRQGSQRFGGRKYYPGKANEEERRAFREYLDSLQKLMRDHGEEIWPAHHQLYARWHRKSSDPNERERVIPLLEELYRKEPKFETHKELLRVP